MEALREEKMDSYTILVLSKDVELLRSVRSTLMQNSYQVKCVRSMYEAYIYLKLRKTNLILIGNDLYDFMARQIYDYLRDSLRENNVQAIVMEENFFSTELIERVKRALE